MVFVDGSWLYYSFHGRRPNCPVTSAYGKGWEYGHSFDYDRLPQLISQQLQDELLRRHRTSRFVEIVRTVVFSSARADTHHRSTRMRMFRQMEEANFEVHMSVTTGIHEKCIDISLAVEMMHYASVEGAYDIAVLVSGDKDFMPALSRIRQKGKRVAICSMRNCCARDLLDKRANVRDFDPVWLDDHLDYLIVPNANALAPGAKKLTSSELLGVVTSYLREQPDFVASSRDIGRRLQGTMLNGADALSQLKEKHAGLRVFVETFPDTFQIEYAEEEEAERGEPGAIFTFFVRLLAPEDGEGFSDDEVLMDAKIGSGSSAAGFSDDDSDGHARRSQELRPDAGAAVAGRGAAQSLATAGGDAAGGSSAGGDPDINEGRLTVTELRAELQRRGLSTAGRKAELVERLIDAESREVTHSRESPREASSAPGVAHMGSGRAGGSGAPRGGGGAPPMLGSLTYRNGLAEAGTRQWAGARQWGGTADGGRGSGRGSSQGRGVYRTPPGAANRPTSDRGGADLDDGQLVSSVVSFLESNGGMASSRNVGRHLAAQNLLQPMKRSHAGLYHFLQKHDQHFTLVLPTASGALEYEVHLATPHGHATPEGQPAAPRDSERRAGPSSDAAGGKEMEQRSLGS